jgi:putative hydrolases of HD superfamily
MQPTDPDDQRSAYVKIAASIRAAILSGELGPGTVLPTGDQLGEFFKVSRPTIVDAIKVLRDEGFVVSRPGGRVYVQGQARLPVDEAEPHPLAGVPQVLHEAGHLKHVTRAGWLLLGISNPESVAEHSYRVSVVGMVLAVLEGADPCKVAALGAMHDLHETRIGDIPSVGRAYVDTAAPMAVTTAQTSTLPDDVASFLRGLTEEYEAKETIEAKVCRDADKLEMLLQAREYAAQGHNTQHWQESATVRLKTKSGELLAQAIMAADPADWWKTFAASYHELRDTSRARQGLPKD